MNPNDPEVPEQAPADVQAPPKPRRRRTPKAAVEAETAGPGPSADSVEPAAASVPQADAVDAGGSSSLTVSVEGSTELAESSAGPEAGQPAGAEGEGRKRRRNRRRGRRSADRSVSAEPGTDESGEGEEQLQVDGEPGGHEPDLRTPSALEPIDPGEVFAEVLSGAYDASATPEGGGDAAGELAAGAQAPVVQPKRVLAPEADAPKLHKVLAQSGVGSRRDLEQMIAEGRVSVNGQAAHTGQRISFGDRIAIDGKQVRVRIAPPLPRVLAYHKPVGEVVTHDDPQQRPTVFRRLPRLQQGKWQSVGRLDINTEGLLLFTNSGDLANRLMHPRFGVEREYAVRVLGALSQEERDKLIAGVEIEGQPAAFVSIEDGGGEGANHWYRVVITEGRNREVRRLFDAVGHAVSRLIRIRYGSVVLPRGLKRGVWVDLGPDDVKALRQATGMPRPGMSTQGPREDRPGRGNRRGRESRDVRQGGAADRASSSAPRGEDLDNEHIGPIPNPLQQTFDKRAIQQARKQREFSEDGPIPNPLQQTYDKRAIQGERSPRREIDEDGPIPNPLQQTYDKRFVQGGKGGFGGFGPGGSSGGGGGGGAGGAGRSRKKPAPQRTAAGERQPDPTRTATGYIGADAFHQKGKGGGGRGGGRGGRGGPRR